MITKYSNVEAINIVEPIDLVNEDTKRKLDNLKDSKSDEDSEIDKKD